MSSRSVLPLCGLLVLLWLPLATVRAQPATSVSKPPLPEIAEEPKTIDPAASMPAELAVKATYDFSDSSLREVVSWLQEEQGLVVLLDNTELSDIGISPAEPISDRLDEAPIYLLLNRLGSLGLAWYFEDEILHITSEDTAAERLTTQTYNVGDLLDSGYEMDDLFSVIENTIAVDSWDPVGPGVLNELGDVLFVGQTDELQRDVQGLLAALRGFARRTFVNDPPQHRILREKLKENVSVDFVDVPLITAIAQLAAIAEIDIRLDAPELREMRVREREPVTLKLTDRKLETVLRAIAMDLELDWILRDGVLWITSSENAEDYLKTAVYDVRDLCRDASESEALLYAVELQAEPDSWDPVGPGTIEIAKPGVVVITQTEQLHQEVLALLETYRTALRSSKRRDREEEDPNEVITTYYRMHANVAQGLSALLPQMVRPDSWKSLEQPEAPGELTLIASAPELSNLDIEINLEESAQTVAIARAVLIIRQTWTAHDEIKEVIRRVQKGDPQHDRSGGGGGGGLGGGGGGGGGFGSGFSIPPTNASEPSN